MSEKISIVVFSGEVPVMSGGWGVQPGAGCGSTNPKADFEDFAKDVKDKYGEDVTLEYVDIMNDSLENYPQVKEIMGRFNPPLTVINGEPRFHGGLSVQMISEAIDEMKNSKEN